MRSGIFFGDPPPSSAELRSMLVPGARQEQVPLMVLPDSAFRYRRLPRQRGHVRPPGGGPQGETCGGCKYRVSVQGGAKSFSKCELNRRNWTRGSASDITRKDPACVRWEAKAE